MIYIGIDPGKSGFTSMSFPSGRISCYETPTMPSGKREVYDPAAMRKVLLNAWDVSDPVVEDDIFCCIEKQQPFPQQGGVSNYSTGFGFGLWLGLLAGLRIPYVAISPREWKKVMLGGSAKDKAASIILAGQLFPRIDLKRTDRCKGPSHDKAESLLLMEYAKKTRPAV